MFIHGGGARGLQRGKSALLAPAPNEATGVAQSTPRASRLGQGPGPPAPGPTLRKDKPGTGCPWRCQTDTLNKNLRARCSLGWPPFLTHTAWHPSSLDGAGAWRPPWLPHPQIWLPAFGASLPNGCHSIKLFSLDKQQDPHQGELLMDRRNPWSPKGSSRSEFRPDAEGGEGLPSVLEVRGCSLSSPWLAVRGVEGRGVSVAMCPLTSAH